MANKRQPFAEPESPHGVPLKLRSRDFHGGRWSACKGPSAPSGQSEPYLGFHFMTEGVRNPGHTYDRTLPTPSPTKGDAS
jgi:hypothetical protein